MNSRFFFCIFVAALQTAFCATWTLDTQIGADFQTYIANTGEDFFPTAMAANGATTLYVAISFINVNADHISQILKWTPASGWTFVSNSDIWGTVNSMHYDAGNLYIGGEFTEVGGIEALNAARFNLSGGSWSAAANNLKVNGTVLTAKAASWGLSTRTYFYVGGQFTTVGQSTSCHNIARGYLNGTNWIWETMNGGVGGSLDVVRTFDVDRTYSYDQFVGYRHRVYVGGNFLTVGSSQAATNLALWTEDVATWNGLANGSGIDFASQDPFQNCAFRTYPNSAHVWSLAVAYNSSGPVYIGGGFNKLGSLKYPTDFSDPLIDCQYYAPINLAKISGSTLGVWDSKNSWSYSPSEQEGGHGGDVWSVAAASANIFLVGGDGIITTTAGAVPTGFESTVPAFHVTNTGTWNAIESATSGSPASTSYEQVCVGGTTAAFFIVRDGNGPSIRRYHQ